MSEGRVYAMQTAGSRDIMSDWGPKTGGPNGTEEGGRQR
jgi:hypothetical protein